MFIGKKGQGGEAGGGAMVVFLLIIVVAAVIGIAIYSFFYKIDTSIDAYNLETKNMILSCQASLISAKTDEAKFAAYCGTFSKPLIIGGKENYVNCKYLDIRGIANFSEEEISPAIKATCTSEISEQNAYNKCKEFKDINAGSSTSWTEYINGVKCNKDTEPIKFGTKVKVA